MATGGPGPDAAPAAPPARPLDLLTAKLSAPSLPPELVVRPRLHERLTAGAGGRATLVSAGPGWGKTMLVAGWAAALPASQPWAWLALDSYDNDPVLFWSYLLAAVRGSGVAEGGSLDGLTVHPPVGASMLRKIRLGLAELSRPLVLVLDDLGEIDNPEVLSGVAELLRHPLPLHLVLVTRADPPLHLHRLRVDGELNEVRVADLAFTEAEADELLHSSGVSLPTPLSRRVLERTEGWAAGLRLAAMVVTGPDLADRVEEFAGNDGAVAEYLLEEVLSGVPPEQRRFLLRTSIADRLCSELADVLSGEPGSQRLLEDLARANAFVVALGSGRVWYRYHALMADLLRHQLLLDEPELVPVLHRRAAAWFASRGEALQAVEYATRAQDWQLVGDLIVNGAGLRVVSAERQAFDALLAQIPAELVSTSAELRLSAALRRFLARDYDGFALQVGQARALLRDREPGDHGPVEAFLRVADVILARARGDVPALIASSREVLRWMAEPGGPGPAPAAVYEAPMLSQLGLGLVWSGQDAEAEPYLRAAIDAGAGAGADLTIINSHGCLALVELTRGRLDEAGRWAGAGLELAERYGATELAQAIVIYLVLAELSLERNDLEEAGRFLEAGLAAHRTDPDQTAYVALQALQARLLLATDDVAGARAVMARLTRAYQPADLPALQAYRLALTGADLDLASGQPEAALARLAPLLDDRAVAVDGLRVCASRAYLALRDFAAADALATATAESAESPVAAVGALLVSAISADQQRDDHRAMAALTAALVLAERHDLRRPFVAQAHPRLAPMLRHALRLSVDESFVRSLLADLDASGGERAAPQPLDEPLTDRECMVLTHLATLQTHAEIAADLYISVNTVKSHARSVYRKLGVTSRRRAVQRARELGVI